jgi:hypothetical protein
MGRLEQEPEKRKEENTYHALTAHRMLTPGEHEEHGVREREESVGADMRFCLDEGWTHPREHRRAGYFMPRMARPAASKAQVEGSGTQLTLKDYRQLSSVKGPVPPIILW